MAKQVVLSIIYRQIGHDLEHITIIQTLQSKCVIHEDYAHLRVYKYHDSKESLRLLRNLVYAKHGYKFQSDELKKIFSEFDWYKPSDTFSESSFTNLEKSVISDIQRYEAE